MEVVLEMDQSRAMELFDSKEERDVLLEAGAQFETWNSWWMKRRKSRPNQPKRMEAASEERVLIVTDDLNGAFESQTSEVEREKSVFSGPVNTKPLLKKDLRIVEIPDRPKQTNVLMNTSAYDEGWCFPALKKVFHENDRVCILAFSFYNDTTCLKDWEKQYGKDVGMWYHANQDSFYRFQIRPNQIVWVNYFTDSVAQMKEKILNSSILVLPGGAPDLMFQRIREKKLASLIKNYTGTIVGFSAGAMIQLEKYHITPDEDYPEYEWQKGLGMIRDLDIEVHYAATQHQKRHIERAMKDSHLPVYAIYEKGGVIFDEKNRPSFFGKVDFFEPEANQ